jgi:hypothetical protein
MQLGVPHDQLPMSHKNTEHKSSLTDRSFCFCVTAETDWTTYAELRKRQSYDHPALLEWAECTLKMSRHYAPRYREDRWEYVVRSDM